MEGLRSEDQFAGDRKHSTHVLMHVEQKIVAWLVPLVPRGLETYHLTLMTFLWGAFIVLSCLMARGNIQWLWGVSFFVLTQYITDMLDGAVGRSRGTGLIKWGYYMDHFADYIFLSCIILGYASLLSAPYLLLPLTLLSVMSALMINSFLSFSVTNEFKIAYFGLGISEVRCIFIVANSFLIFSGIEYLERSLPWILLLCAICLLTVVLRTQLQLWRIDMREKMKNLR